MILLLLIYLILTIKWNLKFIARESKEKEKFVNMYLRILTNYFQELSAIMSIKIDFVINVGGLFENLNFISDIFGNFFYFFYPFECIYQYFQLDIYFGNIFFANLLLLITIYPLIILITILFWLSKGCFNKTSQNNSKINCLATIFVITYILQPSFINSFFKYFNCVKIDGELYLKSYLKEKCWQGDHIFYSLLFVFPALLFWIVLYPLTVLIFLIKNNKKTDSLSRKKRRIFCFLTDGLKKEFFYWEILIMFKKYILIILSIFPISDNMLINVFIMMIFCFATVLKQINEPIYHFEKAKRIAFFSNCLILISSIWLLMLLLLDNALYMQIFIITCFLLCNLILISLWIFDLYLMKKKDLISNIYLMKNKLKDLFKNISDSNKSSKGKVIKIKGKPKAFAQ